jgi:hypothetical protein
LDEISHLAPVLEEDPQPLADMIDIEFTSKGHLTRNSLIQILDARYELNNYRELESLFTQKRLEALDKSKSHFKTIVDVFEQEEQDRLDHNLELLLPFLDCSLEQVHEAFKIHFEDQKDIDFVLNTGVFLQEQVPDWLTYDKAMQIFEEIGR